MDKRTVHSAHQRIDGLEKEIVAIKTEMDIADQGSGAYGDDDIINRVPMAKFATPEDVARTIAFLAGDGSFINGVSLPVDGGWTADASWDALRLKAR